MNNNTKKYYNSKQGRLPLFISDRLDICDPVLAFDKIMEEIGIEKYLKPEPLHKMGRPGYNRVNMLKTILFGFMDTGYASAGIRRPVQSESSLHVSDGSGNTQLSRLQLLY